MIIEPLGVMDTYITIVPPTIINKIDAWDVWLAKMNSSPENIDIIIINKVA